MSRKAPSHARDDVSRRLEELQRRCRDAGLRLTLQRRAVLETLIEFDDHPSSDQVYQRVHLRLPGLSRATVFRILEQFAASGLIGKACHPGRSARYDARTELHHHLVCIRCEAMVDIFDDALDGIPLPDTASQGFQVVDFRVQLRGFCNQCQKQIRKEDD
jgi:Fur family peroxide stress response transcriptional regulator